MALIPPHYLSAVVAIGNRRPDRSVSWVASGFVYGRLVRKLSEDSSQFATFLVTNKHVLDGLTEPVIRANPTGSDPAKELDLSLLDPADGAKLWVGHPDDDIDVVVTRLAMDRLIKEGFDITVFQDGQAATVARMAEVGMSEGDSLFLLGFPMGLVGGPRSAVIVRGATLARFQDARIGQSKSLLVDGYIFPGNSGGPAISKPESMAINGTKAVSMAYLIGVVSSYLPYQDTAISVQTKRPRVVFEENSGLANVYPVDAIEGAIDELVRLYGPLLPEGAEEVAPEGPAETQTE